MMTKRAQFMSVLVGMVLTTAAAAPQSPGGSVTVELEISPAALAAAEQYRSTQRVSHESQASLGGKILALADKISAAVAAGEDAEVERLRAEVKRFAAVLASMEGLDDSYLQAVPLEPDVQAMLAAVLIDFVGREVLTVFPTPALVERRQAEREARRAVDEEALVEVRRPRRLPVPSGPESER